MNLLCLVWLIFVVVVVAADFLWIVSNQTMHSVCQFGWIDKGTIRHFSPTCNHNTIDDRSRLYYFSGLFSLVLFAFAVLCCAAHSLSIPSPCRSLFLQIKYIHTNAPSLYAHNDNRIAVDLYTSAIRYLVAIALNTLNRIENKVDDDFSAQNNLAPDVYTSK